mmetsp:Transcript_13480/g.32981  ORF Transcript_13480/g.32981 Transcript_13480/m.32981 type:complete len:113 (-) Transcript_13480:308-646(-)
MAEYVGLPADIIFADHGEKLYEALGLSRKNTDPCCCKVNEDRDMRTHLHVLTRLTAGPQGDVTRMGGSGMLVPGRGVAWFHRDESPNDHLPAAQLVTLCRDGGIPEAMRMSK